MSISINYQLQQGLRRALETIIVPAYLHRAQVIGLCVGRWVHRQSSSDLAESFIGTSCAVLAEAQGPSILFFETVKLALLPSDGQST